MYSPNYKTHFSFGTQERGSLLGRLSRFPLFNGGQGVWDKGEKVEGRRRDRLLKTSTITARTRSEASIPSQEIHRGPLLCVRGKIRCKGRSTWAASGEQKDRRCTTTSARRRVKRGIRVKAYRGTPDAFHIIFTSRASSMTVEGKCRRLRGSVFGFEARRWCSLVKAPR